MGADRLAAIRARCEKASPAPWVPLPSGSKKWVEIPATDEAIKANRDNDAAFIAASRTDVPDLLAEVDALKRERDAYEEREAACCPEDVGFEEYIATLKRKVERLRDLLKRAAALLPNGSTLRVEIDDTVALSPGKAGAGGEGEPAS